MAYEAYRVNRRFVWDGWQFAPKAGAHRQNFQLLEGVSREEQAHNLKQQGCWDERSCDPSLYAGDIWLVEENHPRKAAILSRNKAVYDSGLPRVDDLLEDEEIKKLLSPPSAVGAR